MSQPNGTATVLVNNLTGRALPWLRLYHRYDNDLKDEKTFYDVTRNAEWKATIPARYWYSSGILPTVFVPRPGSDYIFITLEYDAVIYEIAGGRYGDRDTIRVVDGEIHYTLSKDQDGGTIELNVIRNQDDRGLSVFMDVKGRHGNTVTSRTFPLERKGDAPRRTLTPDERAALGRQQCRLARPRPFYMIAHECNSIDRLSRAIEAGANGVECDVRLEYDGNVSAWTCRHDPKIVEGGVSLKAWLKHIGTLSREGHLNHLAVVIFDIKTHEYLPSLHQAVRTHMPKEVGAIFSVADLGAPADALVGLKDLLGPRDGLAIDAENDAGRVEGFFRDHGVTQCWFGNGIFFGGRDGRNIQDSFRDAGERRNANGVLKKNYGWTYSDEKVVRALLRAVESGHDTALDGVFVELRTLKDLGWPGLADGLRLLRPATRDDDLFTAHCHGRPF